MNKQKRVFFTEADCHQIVESMEEVPEVHEPPADTQNSPPIIILPKADWNNDLILGGVKKTVEFSEEVPEPQTDTRNVPKDWSNYTPKMLRTKKNKVLGKGDREEVRVDENRGKTQREELHQLKMKTLEAEHRRDEELHAIKMKEAAHRNLIMELEKEKLKLEVEILKKTLAGLN